MTFTGKRSFYSTALAAVFAVLVCVMILSSTIGVARISFFDSIRIMLSRIPLASSFVQTGDIDKTHYIIVLNIRMPRIMLSALVGAGLSVVGASFQGMFRNSMADPYVLGISSGAALGATVGIVLGFEESFLGIGLITLIAFAGALLTTLFVYSVARVGGRLPTAALLLSGIAVGLFLSSMITILMIFNRNQIEKIVLWMMGSVSAASWRQVGIISPVVLLGTAALVLFSRELNVMATGEEAAMSLGIEVETVKKLILVISAVLTAACVSVSGIIGFVGLIIPHTIRLLIGSDHRVVLPFSALGGAIFLVLSDTLARNLVPPLELPVGAITSMFGAPFFIYLLIKSKKKVLR